VGVAFGHLDGGVTQDLFHLLDRPPVHTQWLANVWWRVARYQFNRGRRFVAASAWLSFAGSKPLDRRALPM